MATTGPIQTAIRLGTVDINRSLMERFRDNKKFLPAYHELVAGVVMQDIKSGQLEAILTAIVQHPSEGLTDEQARSKLAQVEGLVQMFLQVFNLDISLGVPNVEVEADYPDPEEKPAPAQE